MTQASYTSYGTRFSRVAALIAPVCPAGQPERPLTPLLPGDSAALEGAGHGDLAGGRGRGLRRVGFAGQPAAHDRQRLAAVGAQQGEDVEALAVVQLPLRDQQLIVVPAGDGGLLADRRFVHGQQLGQRARRVLAGRLLLRGGGLVVLHPVLEPAELPGTHEDAEGDGQDDEDVDPPPSGRQQKPVHALHGTVRARRPRSGAVENMVARGWPGGGCPQAGDLFCARSPGRGSMGP
ncbi:hypothetical protein RKD37_004459 [Streptomyces ambofaciens]